MRYYKLIVFTTGEEFETKEKLIDEPTFRKVQKAILTGQDFIVLEDRIIKAKQIKEVLPAIADVQECLDQGISLKQLGLPELPRLGNNPHLGLENSATRQIDGKEGLLRDKYEKMKSRFMEKSSIPSDIRTAAQEEERRNGNVG